ncbi:hypothetical protein [Actinophytocola glycyrrhizae]|uniref:Anti-sigma-YlaC factor YlaD n=1 Tax=Actinophytocola glycyrrhizae TaxID=2044873 RepID=A0ABV9S7B3_9PSEU
MKTCWNWPTYVTDYFYVDCEEYREALSARLDDEEGPDDGRHPADHHLDHCADCATWYDNAALITRRTRTTAAVSWPDVADAVLARVPAGPTATSARLRVALGAVGVAHGASAVLSLAHDGELQTAAWRLALAVAFCAVAAQRVRPAALVPLLGTFVGVLSWGYVSGLAVDAAGALSYLLSSAGLVLVVLLGRLPRARRGPVPPEGDTGTVRPARDTGTGDGKVDGIPPLFRRITPTKAA